LVAAGTGAAAAGFDDTGGVQAAGPDCPGSARPLPANGLAPASSAALSSQRGRYEELGTAVGGAGPRAELEGPLDTEPPIAPPSESEPAPITPPELR
jgi:hypothetical protein